jgi:hypothetical protein
MSRVAAAVFCLVIAFPAMAADEPRPAEPTEPPVRLRKKEKPRPAPASEKPPAKQAGPTPPKPAPPAPDEPALGDPEENPAERAARLSRNMRASEERLAKKDAGQETRHIQRDILKDLDALIELAKQRQGDGSSSGSPQPQRSQARQTATARPQPQAAQATQPAGSPRAGDRQTGAGRGGRDREREGTNKIADLYKDVWGHLPETLRQEMDQYSREQFMAKYGDLLKQYYATIAEKGRRQGD